MVRRVGAESVAFAARGLTVRGPRGPVFENVDVDVPAGELLVVHGPAGSGRTSLLLALAGRMRPAAGAVRVGAYRLPGAGRAVHRLVAVARAGPAAGLEPRLRVREAMAERCWISPGVTGERLREAFAVLGIDPPESALIEDLSPDEQVLLAVGLALAGRPGAIVVDDVEAGCTGEQRGVVWRALEEVCRSGPTVLASATGPPAAPAGSLLGSAWQPVLVGLPRRSGDRLSPNPAQATDRMEG